jgi:hypothetical protein
MMGSATAAADAGGRWSGGKTKLSGSASWDAAEDNSWFSIAPSLSLSLPPPVRSRRVGESGVERERSGSASQKAEQGRD